MALSLFLSSVIVFLDQLTKLLFYGLPAKSIIGDLLWFESTLNTGIAFSMFKDSVPFFIVVSIIACIIFVFLIINNKIIKNKPEKICLGIILGGAFSNLLDRVIYSGVRDFIYLKFINFAIFNIADMAVSFGAVIFCIFYMISELKEYKLEKVKEIENANKEKIELESSDDKLSNLGSNSTDNDLDIDENEELNTQDNEIIDLDQKD